MLDRPVRRRRVWVTPGGGKSPWWSSDGRAAFTDWTNTGKTVGDIPGNDRMHEVIDTAKHPQMRPVRWHGVDYRLIALTESWTTKPHPHTVVLLSNTLTERTVAGDGKPILPPTADSWGEKGTAVGSAFVLPDGNLLLAACACTNEGYTGAPEPTNVSAIVDGREPWRVLKLATLPDAPVSWENVWYQGPNFGTALVADERTGTLYYYGGFHDSSIGMMRATGFAPGQPRCAGVTGARSAGRAGRPVARGRRRCSVRHRAARRGGRGAGPPVGRRDRP